LATGNNTARKHHVTYSTPGMKDSSSLGTLNRLGPEATNTTAGAKHRSDTAAAVATRCHGAH